jgi:hypothetical protein
MMDTDDTASRKPAKQAPRKMLFKGGNKYTMRHACGKEFPLVENRTFDLPQYRRTVI